MAAPETIAPKNLPALRALLVLTPPVAIGIALLAAWVVLTSFNLRAYPHEMAAGAAVNIVAGILALLPMVIFMARGTTTIARTAMLATALRLGLVFIGLVLALGPGWHLAQTPTVIWTAGCYVVLLIAESLVVAWILRR